MRAMLVTALLAVTLGISTNGKPILSFLNTYRLSQNYPNVQFFAIFATALKPLMLWFPKFSELLISSQS